MLVVIILTSTSAHQGYYPKRHFLNTFIKHRPSPQACRGQKWRIKFFNYQRINKRDDEIKRQRERLRKDVSFIPIYAIDSLGNDKSNTYFFCGLKSVADKHERMRALFRLKRSPQNAPRGGFCPQIYSKGIPAPKFAFKRSLVCHALLSPQSPVKGIYWSNSAITAHCGTRIVCTMSLKRFNEHIPSAFLS